MSKTEKATAYMEALAEDKAHGYDQTYRWGEYGDYDCSSAVITAWEEAGVPVKTTGATYTGNMRGVFMRCGFVDVTKDIELSTGKGLLRGDVLLNHERHTAMYIGDGKEVEASINEFGTARGGRPGDQTGREILVRDYRNYPWNCVLRYAEDAVGEAGASEEATGTTEALPTPDVYWPPRELEYGMIGDDVIAMQGLLCAHGFFLDCDGEFGPRSKGALAGFQAETFGYGDGRCDNATWSALLKRG